MGIKITKNNNLLISCFNLVIDVLKLKMWVFLWIFFSYNTATSGEFGVGLCLANQWMMGEICLKKKIIC